MTNSPYNKVIRMTINTSSLIGNPGGDGGFLNPGDGGCGAARATETHKRYIIAIKYLLAIVFIIIS